MVNKNPDWNKELVELTGVKRPFYVMKPRGDTLFFRHAGGPVHNHPFRYIYVTESNVDRTTSMPKSVLRFSSG